jgi:hypothetical protein
MNPWLVLLILLVVEIALLLWWLRRQVRPLFFNTWAPLLYMTVLAADFVATWYVSSLSVPGGTEGASLLAVLGIIGLIVVALGTLFFRWVIRLDMTDITKQ